jgi:hypothetical protein
MHHDPATSLEREPVGTVRQVLGGTTDAKIISLATLAALQVEAGQLREAAGTFAELAALDPHRREQWACLHRACKGAK